MKVIVTLSYTVETLKTLKTSFLSQLLTISDEHTICAKLIKVEVISHEGFLGLCFSLSSSRWFEVGGIWKRGDVTYFHEKTNTFLFITLSSLRHFSSGPNMPSVCINEMACLRFS